MDTIFITQATKTVSESVNGILCRRRLLARLIDSVCEMRVERTVRGDSTVPFWRVSLYTHVPFTLCESHLNLP